LLKQSKKLQSTEEQWKVENETEERAKMERHPPTSA
jgi:hypothetical protein